MRKGWSISICVLAMMLWIQVAASAAAIDLYFAPDWGDKADKAQAIAAALSKESGLTIKARVAKSYPELIEMFSVDQPVPVLPVLVYGGSFVQAVLLDYGASVPILQGVDGKELYSSVLIVPQSAGTDVEAIIKAAGSAVSYAKAASSGESGAKAATGGQAAVATRNHAAALEAVQQGRAKAAFVKNWWWEANKEKYPGYVKLDYPGVSDHKNPDNVLTANKAVSKEEIAKIKAAALKSASVFGVKSFADFDASSLDPTLDLMKKAQIQPSQYRWN